MGDGGWCGREKLLAEIGVDDLLFELIVANIPAEEPLCWVYGLRNDFPWFAGVKF